jgi:pyruvate formate lyase activating enzyme
MSQGQVFNIQKFSIHDGPGIRTIVFLKGCLLRCQWCSNPEGIDCRPTLAVNLEKCITTAHCSRCLEKCTRKAIARDTSTLKITVDREKCDLCGHCVTACPAQAFKVFGTLMTVDEVMKVVEQDELFYAASGGGLTLSGGDPLFQPGFARDLLQKAQSYGFETAIETSGHGPWSDAKMVFEHCDFIHYDIKSMDSIKHKAFTGVDNHRILSNLQKTCEHFPQTAICVRTPVIPGFNDTHEDISQILSFLKDLPRKVDYELLDYHQFGENKYTMIGKETQAPDFKKSDGENFEILKKIILGEI